MSRGRLWWRAALAAALAACVDGPGGPGRFGEVRVEPAYRAGYEPAAIGVALDTAAVLVERLGTGERLVDTTVPYGGGALAWIVDLLAAEESLAVAVELYSAGSRLYQGDTTVVAEDGTVAGETHALAVAYVGPPRVAVVTVTPATASLAAVGATRQFTAEARDPNGDTLAGVTFAWSTSNAGVATVDSGTGLATAAGHGTATITATANGISGSATVDVDFTTSVDTVIVSPAGATLTTVGATQQFTAEARDANGNALPGLGFTWSSSVAAVAAVDATGLATATGHGSATITASTSGTSGAATLTVDLVAVVDTVVVTPVTTTLTTVGATQQFAAEARDSSGTVLPGVTFTWTSSVPAVATVDSTGRATAAGHGSTAIIAATGSKAGAATLTVNLAATVDTVIVTPAAATLTALGATQQFAAEARDSAGTVLPGITFVWTTSAAGVATIDSGGVTTATGQGTATITATGAGKSGAAAVTVNLLATVDTVLVTPAAATLSTLGTTQQFTAEARDSNGIVLPGITFVWATSAAGVAAVDSSGVATATGHGTATITAAAAGKSGAATVTVDLVATVDTVIVTPAAATLTALGQTQPFTAEARDSNGTVLPGIAFVWATSVAGVATVDSSGMATATGHGAATITASAAGKSGAATVTVDLVATVDTVIVTPAAATLTALGTTQQFVAEARDSSGTVLPGVTFAWSTSAANVAMADSTGLATATGHGSATITATTAGKSGTASLTVDLVAAVDTVIVSPAGAALIGLGATQRFAAEARDSNGTVLVGLPFTWSSSVGAVATVDSTGLATATGHGTTVITAATAGKSGSAQLTVDLVATVDTVVVTPPSALLSALGATRQFTAEARDSIGQVLPGVTFVWTSSVGAVATVDSTGLATATGHGSTTITAGAAGKSGAATLAVDLLPTVDTVIVTPDAATLAALGATQAFTAEARDSSGAVVPGVGFVWTSGDATVAAIDSLSGVATAAGNGAATITATAGTASGAATLTVAQEVVTVVVTPGAVTLTALDATQQFTAEARDANGHAVSGAPFTWQSGDTTAVAVDSTGLATALANGSTTITAASGSVAATASVTVAQVVAAVTVTPGTATLTALGATQPLTAEARDANGHLVPGAAFVWTSDNAAVAVDSTGLATAVGNGTATVTATASTVAGTASVTVAQVVTSVTVTPAAASLSALGAAQLLTAEARDANGHLVPGAAFVWASDNAAVTVDSIGLATAAANGAATIAATSGTATGTARVTVAQVVVSVTVAPTATTLTSLGATQQLSAQALDANGHAVAGATFAWQSADATVVSVDPASGLAQAVANGSAIITATTGAIADSATVTVAQVVSSVTVTPGTTTLAAFGATQQVTAAARDANGHVVPGVAFAWTSDNAVVTVDSTGLVTALANGAATVSATTGGVAGTATVTVAQVVTTVTVTPATTSLSALGATQQLTAEARDANGHLVAGAALAWSTSDAAVVSVDPVTGLATAVGNGSATVTADAGTASGNAAVSVAQVVATIVVQPDSATLVGIEKVQQFAATPLDANGHAVPGVTFAWSSSNVNVARVNASGRALSVGFGTTTISATAAGVVGTAILVVVP